VFTLRKEIFDHLPTHNQTVRRSAAIREASASGQCIAGKYENEVLTRSFTPKVAETLQPPCDGSIDNKPMLNLTVLICGSDGRESPYPDAITILYHVIVAKFSPSKTEING